MSSMHVVRIAPANTNNNNKKIRTLRMAVIKERKVSLNVLNCTSLARTLAGECELKKQIFQIGSSIAHTLTCALSIMIFFYLQYYTLTIFPRQRNTRKEFK